MSPTFSEGPATDFSCCAEARGLHSEATISQATSPTHAARFIHPPFEALAQSHDGNANLRICCVIMSKASKFGGYWHSHAPENAKRRFLFHHRVQQPSSHVEPETDPVGRDLLCRTLS